MSRCSTQPPIPTSLRPFTLDLITVWINRHRNPNSRFTRSLSTAPVDLGSRESTGGDLEGGSPTPPFPLLGERRALKCRALLEPPAHILRSPPRPISWGKLIRERTRQSPRKPTRFTAGLSPDTYYPRPTLIFFIGFLA